MKDMTLERFCEAAASREPVPGGGGVCALAGSLASALGEMVTNLTIGKKNYLEYTFELTQMKKELDIIRSNLLDCIKKDADAFRPLSQAYGMDKDDPARDKIMEECLKKAAEPPLLIFRYCLRIIDLDERLAQIGAKSVISDAATSVMLAHGVLYGAYVNILANTRLMKDREYARQLEDDTVRELDEYAVKALNVYDDICKRLTDA